MKLLRHLLDQHEKLFAKGSKLERGYPLHEALDTFCFTPGQVTQSPAHVRDALDMKRLMMTVVIALIPCMLMAMYNTGLQTHLALEAGYQVLDGWRLQLMQLLGLSLSSDNVVACIIHGALYYLPVVAVTFAVGGAWEALFAIVRKHEINEGFLVTGTLFPLICPPSIPLWQVAIGISFGVVVGKELFGGTGMNFLNPALTGRCFLFFAYPQQFSGNEVWVAGVDGYSSATTLAAAAESGLPGLTAAGWSWWEAFIGVTPGSMGETSALFCLLGAALLLATGIGSWRIMAGVTIGTVAASLLLNLLAPLVGNPSFAIPFYWHLVVGSWAFGTVFMATDPVSATYTNTGKWIYGAAIGVLIILIRTVNPAYPEGTMLAILFMNTFAALIDHYVVKANIKRRALRYAEG